MKILNELEKNRVSQKLSVRILNENGDISRQSITAMEEALVSIYIDDAHIYDLPCSPEDIPELVIGWVVTEADISYDMIESLVLRPDEDISDLIFAHISTCADSQNNADPKNRCAERNGGTGDDASEMLFSSMDMTVTENWQWLYRLQERFMQERPLRKITKAAHSCMLVRLETESGIYRDFELLYQSEDAGRHSAMDKAIGRGIISGTDMRSCILFTSGRISTAMVRKAVRSGAAALVTAKPLVTTGAVDTARKNGLLLAGIDEETREIHIFS